MLEPDVNDRPRGFWLKEMCGLFLLFWMLLLILSLLSFDRSDPSLNHAVSSSEVANLGGLIGAYTAGFLNDLFGSGSLVLPVVLGGVAIGCLTRRLSLTWWRWVGCALLGISALVFFAALDVSIGDLSGGGMIGAVIARGSQALFSPFGATLLWLFVFFVGLQLFVDLSWRRLMTRTGDVLGLFLGRFVQRDEAGTMPGRESDGNSDADFAFEAVPESGDRPRAARLQPGKVNAQPEEEPGLLDRAAGRVIGGVLGGLQRVGLVRPRFRPLQDGEWEEGADNQAGRQADGPAGSTLVDGGRAPVRARTLILSEEDIPFASTDESDVPMDHSYADQYARKVHIPRVLEEDQVHATRSARIRVREAADKPLLNLLSRAEQDEEAAQVAAQAGDPVRSGIDNEQIEEEAQAVQADLVPGEEEQGDRDRADTADRAGDRSPADTTRGSARSGERHEPDYDLDELDDLDEEDDLPDEPRSGRNTDRSRQDTRPDDRADSTRRERAALFGAFDDETKDESEPASAQMTGAGQTRAERQDAESATGPAEAGSRGRTRTDARADSFAEQADDERAVLPGSAARTDEPADRDKIFAASGTETHPRASALRAREEERPVSRSAERSGERAPEKDIREASEAGSRKTRLTRDMIKREADPDGPVFPPLELLDRPEEGPEVMDEELDDCAQALMGCLSDFGIQADLVRATPGPVVTTYMLRPAPGVSVRAFVRHTEDIARSLMAVSVFIQAPVPGTDTVGIVIPNRNRAIVNFREIAEDEVFAESKAALPLIVGRDTTGKPYVGDLARMPHLLVAGATGQGKSVCLNAMLTSLLLRKSPDELKLLLVDPKRVEMGIYEDESHLVHPVVKEVSDAKNALLWAVHEMDQRYSQMSRLYTKNIAGYNAKLASYKGNLPPDLADLVPMPYIVIVIDELADLMLQARKDVEPCIIRLAQLARACGIHMIIATQRPSVDVVTGLIKANFPCRICFRVSSRQDSITTLGSAGAEKLLGNGDMFYNPNGGHLTRLHGPYLKDEEVQAVVDFWKKQVRPHYQVDFATWNEDEEEETRTRKGEVDSTDAMYRDVVDFCKEKGHVSISLLQRRFNIGFNKAARYMDQLDRDGLVGPSPGAGKPRPVLIK
ncbi:MAG TPA: DNA translocase FtsK 4TM domain-containing protein [Candidatus Desulfovibrio intestinipullorum]|uniref:DNA translocase FtsK 4TM domain-containing protein n=1 Tax=Candidatus Desulfovibrio intestinipullorum TaxID=2838536 RepID=A0A9D1PYG3_9BACT|nr:DNA translocase FtsK 4TM domain-containing protein [Candidatus Desulfovibrio intestinipullorum]